MRSEYYVHSIFFNVPTFNFYWCYKDYEKIVEMRRPEVEAISRLLRSELQKESRRSFWKNFIVNLFFFALGFVANTIIAAIL